MRSNVRKIMEAAFPDMNVEKVILDLEDLLGKVEDDGYNQGYDQGWGEGYDQGLGEGYDQGYDQGLEDADR